MINKYLKKFSPTANHPARLASPACKRLALSGRQSEAGRQSPVTGFTLIELLVVISIMAILISVATARYQTSEKQARDVKRKSDLSQYRIALENYSAVNNSLYPTPAGSTCVDAATSLCTDSYKTVFIPACPDDPRKDTNYRYLYCENAQNYTLSSKMETRGTIWQICSSGQTCLTTASTYPMTEACLCGSSSEPVPSPTP